MTNRVAHLRTPTVTRNNGHVRFTTRFESPSAEPYEAWIEASEEWAPRLTGTSDPFLLLILMRAMRQGHDLVVHGPMSPGLLANLETFVEAWAMCMPDRYSPIRIEAEDVAVIPSGERPTATMVLSGGVDSTFTLYQHAVSRCRFQRREQIGLVMLVQGFDIPLDANASFAEAARRCRKLADAAGVELLTLRTNVRQGPKQPYWIDSYGTACAAVLTMASPAYHAGLIAGAIDWPRLSPVLGTHPTLDPMLGSRSFRIVHDGAGYSRLAKIRTIAAWPPALMYLRVCWAGDGLGRNCGRCRKCVTTRLMLQVAGVENPPCFPHVSERVIRDTIATMDLQASGAAEFVTELLDAARASGLDCFWVAALQRRLFLERTRLDPAIRRIRGVVKQARNRLREAFC